MASPRLTLSIALAAVATIVVPAAASASPLPLPPAVAKLATVADPRCGAEATTRPFTPWADHADYVPAPGGSFEPGDHRWSLTPGATIAPDNEPWHVSGATSDASALALPAGATAVSPDFCGGFDHPTVRLFARAAGSGTATGLVTVRYTGGGHLLGALPLGVITVGPRWTPTSATLTLSGVRLLTGAHLGLSLTTLTGTVLFDDVYVDPYRRS